MAQPVVVAVLVYAASGAPGAVPAPGPRAALVASLRTRAIVVDHAIDTALADRKDGWRSLDELSFFARGRAALERGRRARDRVEHAESERQLALAEGIYSEGTDEPGVASLAADAALEHGVTLGELGRVDEARAAFVRALSWWPSATLTEKVARPDVVRLFREAQKLPREGERQPFTPDVRVAALEHLQTTPSQSGAETLRATLGVDAVIMVAASSDGTKLVAARVESGCATAPRVVEVSSIGRVLDDRCVESPLTLSVDDPRLFVPVPLVYTAVAPMPAPKERAKWLPWVVAGASAAGLAVIGVGIGFAVSDPRYKAHVVGF